MDAKIVAAIEDILDCADLWNDDEAMGDPWPESYTHALALMRAAPAMLDALIELVERAEAGGDIDGLPEYDQAQAAIAQAKGEA